LVFSFDLHLECSRSGFSVSDVQFICKCLCTFNLCQKQFYSVEQNLTYSCERFMLA
jgi:hypothetical protein